jgi:hypothetical protein
VLGLARSRSSIHIPTRLSIRCPRRQQITPSHSAPSLIQPQLWLQQ